MKSVNAANSAEGQKPVELALRPGGSMHNSEFKALAFILLERVWLLILCLLAGVGFTYYYLSVAPRIYSSVATIQVEQSEHKVVKIESVVSEDLRSLEVMNTIAQRLKSRVLLEEVVVTNNLARNKNFLPPGTTRASLSEMVTYLDSLIETRLRRSTRLIDVVVSHTDPRLSAMIANSVVDQFINQESQMYLASTLEAYNFLKQESESLRKKLESSEHALQDYRKKVASISLQQSQDIIVPQLHDLSQRVTAARAERMRAQQLCSQIDRAKKDFEALTKVPVVAVDPTFNELRAANVKFKAEFAAIQARYLPRHPKYVQAAKQQETLRTELTNAVMSVCEVASANLESAKVLEEMLGKALEEAENQALNLSEQAIQFNVLSREVDSDRALFDSVIARMKETSVSKAIQPDQIRMIQPPTVPERPSSPKEALVMAGGVFASLLAGVLLSLLLHTLDSSLRTVDEVEEYLQLPIIGTIPHLLELANRKKGGIMVQEESTSTIAEAFRTVRASLALLGREENNRVFLFTSAFPQEGKTFCSVNTAATLAQQGLRTLLIDVDLRRPAVEERIFGRDEKRPGVAEMLLGEKQLSEVLTDTPMPNLKCALAGRRLPNPAEVLAQGGFNTIVEQALKDFDRVVIDSAPVHAVSDTLLVLKRVDHVCMVIRSGKTPRRAVQRAVQMIQNAGASLGGVIVNWLPLLRSRGYYYGSYYYGSHYYGQDYYGHDKDKKGKGGKKEKKEAKQTQNA